MDNEEVQYTAEEEELGDAKWDSAYINALPDAAFAAIDDKGQRHLPHHDSSVKKATENASVDKPHLRNALARCSQTMMSSELKATALAHLKRHAKALGIGDEEVADLIGDEEEVEDEVTLESQITNVATFESAEELLYMAMDSEDEDLVRMASEKVSSLVSTGREAVSDAFEGTIELGEKLSNGTYQFTAIVAQADTVNKNRRLYPKEEFEKNLKRVNRLCKAGKFTGRDGHGSMFGPDNPSEICVRYDRVFMQGDDLVMEGILIPTQAGLDIATLWDHGVKTEWSIVGYGNPVYEGEGKKEYAKITDYVLDGCDPVRRGAATTKTVTMTKSDSFESLGEGIMDNEETKDGEQKVVVTQPAAPEINVDELKTEAINAAVAAAVAEAGKAAGDAAVKAIAEATAAAKAAATLESAKAAAIAALADSDSQIALLVSRHFDRCEDAEAVAKVVEEITPMVEGLRKPKMYTGIGIHTESDRAKGWFNGSKTVERPETVSEVKAGLMDGIPDNGAENPSNMRWTFERMLDNYEKNYPQYFNACTRRGFSETATETNVLGTQLPMVLPLIRQIFPMLIPYEIQSVQPLSQPTGRVHFLDFEYDSGSSDGSSIDDTTQFDTSWADHTEGELKSKMALSFSSTDLTAADKSIYYDITSNLIQDMRALHGLDAEAEILSAAADQIAREINMKYLEMIAAGAGTDAGTFGLTKPTGWESQENWYSQGLSLYVNQAMSKIGEKFYTPANWAFTTPAVASMFAATHKWESADVNQINQFGFGIRREGTYDGKLTIYSVSWGKVLTSVKNKMIFGFYPPDWKYTGSVYAPYIPLYVSPQDSNASLNTISRSVTTRAAMKVLQPNAFSTLTVASGQGVEPTFID